VDESFEAKLAQETIRAAIKLGLHFEEKRGGVLISRYPFVGARSERAK
jgi:hypothetical protein